MVRKSRLRHTNVWRGITFQLERAYEDGPGSHLFEFQLSTICEQILIEMSYSMHISYYQFDFIEDFISANAINK